MRTSPTLTTLTLLCVGAGLLACSPFRPFSVVGREPGAALRADEAYLAGRNHHLARRYEEARASYQMALETDPGHANARNGLATLHAEQRDFAGAITIWRELTASLEMSSGPGKAYLFSNLGHAYFLSGDYDNALVALEKACLLDPLNHRSWQLLGESLRKLGQETRAQQMLKQADALREHDFRSDFAAAGGKTSVAAIGQAVRAQVQSRDEPDWVQARLHVGANGMLELRRGPAPAAPAPAEGATVVAAIPETARLEIRNGNGVPGMARRLARQVGEPGLKVMRLSNERGFGVRQTRIEYEAAYRASAQRLAERIGQVQLREVQACAPADLRLVLGRDLARGKFALRPAGSPSGARKPGPGAAGAAATGAASSASAAPARTGPDKAG
jgi:tetratricopeptide (TPR) repeat protein